MYVMIGDTHKIIKDNITTTNAIKEVVNNPERFPGFKVTKCTSGNDRWYVYNDDYVVPAGQYYTRMGFVSIETTVGQTGGNILDGISFELKTPAPIGDLDDAVEK